MTEPASPTTARNALLAALLALATLVAYAPALGGGFVWDDDAHVTQNPRLDSVEGLVQIWTDPRAIPQRQNYPLTFTTFWVETRLYGVDPFGYHLVNVLLHIASALLLWRLLLRWGIPGAFLAAALFALHPIEVESVAWVSERKNTLSTFLYLLAFSCFPFEAPTKLGTRRWLGSLALYALAVSAKTVTATLPGALLVAQWYRNGRLRVADAIGTAPFFIVGLLMALPTRDIERNYVGAVGPDWDFTWIERFEIASRAWWFYLGKVVWPFHNSFVYERFAIDGASLIGMGLLAAAAALGALLLVLRDRIGRGPFAALAIFSGSLLPALGFFDVFPFRYSFVADHFSYLGSLGAITLVASGLATASAGWPPRARAVATAALLAGLGTLTFQHSRAFESDETLWKATLVEQPEHWFAHNNLGAIYLDTGRVAEARPHFEAALAGRPQSVGIVENLARVTAALGDSASARAYTEQWIAASPSDARAVFGLVAICMSVRDSACVSKQASALRELIPQLRAANEPFWQVELGPLCERVGALGRTTGFEPLIDIPGCPSR
jgi:hypothetical protein